MKKKSILGVLLIISVFMLCNCSNSSQSNMEENTWEDSATATSVPYVSETQDASMADVTADDMEGENDMADADDMDESDSVPASAEVSDKAVPNLQSFGNNCLSEYSTQEGDASTTKIYFVDVNFKFLQEYIQLLEDDYHFELRKKGQTSDVDIYNYAFDYTGPEKVSSFHDGDLEEDAVELAMKVYFMGSDEGEIHISYADGLDYVDTGDRTGQKLSNRNGDGDSYVDDGSDYSYDDEDTGNISNSQGQTKCSRCHGNGTLDCTSCGGSGEKTRRESVPNYAGSTDSTRWYDVKESCSRCRGRGKIDCTMCGGSGYR